MRVGGIAGFYGVHVAANAIERENCLAEILPLIFRRAAKREAKDEFGIAAHGIVKRVP